MSESSQAVFISYTSQDAEAARRVCESLQAGGIEVWLDRSELRGGDAWDSAIRKQIKACALFLPVISANTSARSEGYFRLEWKLAVDRSHLMATERAFILPLVIDGTPEGGALVPDKFREVQWTSCPGGVVSPEFVARVARLLSPDSQPTSAAGVSAPATLATAPSRRRAWGRDAIIVSVSAAALVTVGVLGVYKKVFQSKTITMVAVLPFENATGDPANEYLGNGISESLINKLSGLSDLHVVSRTSAFAFKGKAMEPIEIGRKLGVDALVLGNLTMHDSRLNISTELVRVSDSTQLWGDKYERVMDDVQPMEVKSQPPSLRPCTAG
jgi:TolB-like protein